MSHVRVKTEYQIQGAYGSTEKRILYAHHNNSCDIVTFFDEDGTYLFSVEDTMDNNLMDAINILYAPHKNTSGELNENVQFMDADDMSKCGL
jgi:uncharacterized protein YrzB (UPF0473 family)